MKHEYLIKNIEGWDELAQDLVKELKPGSVITLSGPLGAGKTTFVQALARQLGVEGNPRSPTFSLMRTYTFKECGSVSRLIHVDAYRLEKPTDILSLNLDEEMAEPGTILAIEWPENIQGWLDRQAEKIHAMRISLQQDGSRIVTLKD